MSEPFIGQINMFGFKFAPKYWISCGGSLVNISQYQSVFALLGTYYGGDGRTTFALPNLNSRSPVGYQSTGTTYGFQPYYIGQMGGAQNISLTMNHMAPHSHTASFHAEQSGGVTASLSATTEDGDSATPSLGAYLAKTVAGPSGQDQPEKIYKSNPDAASTVELGGVDAAINGVTGQVVVNTAGAGQVFSIQNPYTAVNFCIAMAGIFPPRN